MLFWWAIETGLVTYSEAKDMYEDELTEVIQAHTYLTSVKNDAISEAMKELD